MALQGTYLLNGQVALPDVYVKALSVRVSKTEGVSGFFGVFGSKESADSGAEPIAQFCGAIAPYVEAQNPLAAAYIAQKAVTPFDAMQDV